MLTLNLRIDDDTLEKVIRILKDAPLYHSGASKLSYVEFYKDYVRKQLAKEEVNEFGYIYVFDYCDKTITEVPLEKDDILSEDYEYTLRKHNFNVDACAAMVSKSRLCIDTIKTKNN